MITSGLNDQLLRPRRQGARSPLRDGVDRGAGVAAAYQCPYNQR
jgi:hypothetical protein